MARQGAGDREFDERVRRQTDDDSERLAEVDRRREAAEAEAARKRAARTDGNG